MSRAEPRLGLVGRKLREWMPSIGGEPEPSIDLDEIPQPICDTCGFEIPEGGRDECYGAPERRCAP